MTDKMREAFENLELRGYTDLTVDSEGSYKCSSVRNRWIGYQAAYEAANAEQQKLLDENGRLKSQLSSVTSSYLDASKINTYLAQKIEEGNAQELRNALEKACNAMYDCAAGYDAIDIQHAHDAAETLAKLPPKE